jgi:hypothetical protein
MLKDQKAVFLSLNHKEEYFPIVAWINNQAFFALPPEAINPKAPKLAYTDRAPTNDFTAPFNHGSYNDKVDNSFLAFNSSSDDKTDTDLTEPAGDGSERGSTGAARVNRTL